MQIDITGHHVDVTSAMRDYVDNKMNRVERHFDTVSKAHVVLSVEKLRHTAEATLDMRGGPVHAKVTENDMYAAIDGLTDRLDRMVKKRKEKMTDHHSREAQKQERHAAALVAAAS